MIAPVAEDHGWARPLMHATGALLVLLVPLHVAAFLVDPAESSSLALVGRWERPGWLLVDWGFLAIGTLHLLAALWVRVANSSLSPAAQTRLVVGAGGSLLALFVAASWSMLILV